MYCRYGKVKTTGGHVQDYLGMTFDLSDKDKLKIDMIDYMNATIENFTI